MHNREKQKGEGVWYINNGVRGQDLNSLPRCTAISVSTGRPCKNPAMKNRDLCCVHAGYYKPGAPKGNKNSLKHGHFTAEAISQRKEVVGFVDELNEMLDKIMGKL